MKQIVIFSLAVLLGVVSSEVIGGSNEQDAIDILKAIQRLHALNGQDNVKDTVIHGRAIRIIDNDGCITVQDMDTKFKVTKCGDKVETATALATEELFQLLIKIGHVSFDDLHVKPPVETTPAFTSGADCKDQFSQAKCEFHVKQGLCDPDSRYFVWMHTYCFKTCASCLSREEFVQAHKLHNGN